MIRLFLTRIQIYGKKETYSYICEERSKPLHKMAFSSNTVWYEYKELVNNQHICIT